MRTAFLLAALVSALVTNSCSAKDVRAPVNVATELYVGCLVASVQSTRDIEPTRVGINAFVEDADKTCLAWMVVWFQPLMGYGIETRSDYVARFHRNRLAALQQLTDELRTEALIK